MGFYAIFFAYLVVLFVKSKDKDLATTRYFFLSFSLFFLFTLLNYLIFEIHFYLIERGQPSIFPEIVPEDYSIPLFHPINTDVFLFLFFMLATVPMTFAMEYYIMQRRPFLTVAGLVGLVLISLVIVGVDILLPVMIIYSYLMYGILTLGVLAIYIQMVIKSTGEPRKTAFFLTIGFILQFVGVLFTSMGFMGEWSEEFGHAIAIVGMVLIFLGLVRMK